MNLISAFLKSKSFFNPSNEHVSMFIVEKGELIEHGDFVVVNMRTLLARKPIANTKEATKYFSVGVAIKIVSLADGNQAVICKDGYHMVYDYDKNISEDDIEKVCYFSGSDTITLENDNKTKAGVIVDFEISNDPIDIADGTERIVWIKNDLTEVGDVEWY